MLANIEVRKFVFPSLSKNVRFRIYKIINLPVVLYVCETWPLTLRDEHIEKVAEEYIWTEEG
jgi:hypothetical protein